MPNNASPALERRWIEEVVYLHALWRQGPPHRRPNPNPNPNPKPTPTLTPTRRLSKPPAFKKRKKQRGKKKNTPATPEKEWPCPPATASPDPEASGWTDPPPAAPRPPPSAEEQARAAAAQVQQAAIAACKKFFSIKNGSDDEEEDDDDADGVESEVYGFFLGLFKEDGELREYYERNCDKGEFYCLVCTGIGEKKGRRYPDCVGLVQHANAISKTKRPAAHRALAKAVCRVLAWDIDRLPSIVLDLADPLGKSLADQKEDYSALKEEIPQQAEEIPEEVDDAEADHDDAEADHEDATSDIEASPRDGAKEEGNAVQ